MHCILYCRSLGVTEVHFKLFEGPDDRLIDEATELGWIWMMVEGDL